MAGVCDCGKLCIFVLIVNSCFVLFLQFGPEILRVWPTSMMLSNLATVLTMPITIEVFLTSEKSTHNVFLTLFLVAGGLAVGFQLYFLVCFLMTLTVAVVTSMIILFSGTLPSLPPPSLSPRSYPLRTFPFRPPSSSLSHAPSSSSLPPAPSSFWTTTNNNNNTETQQHTISSQLSQHQINVIEDRLDNQTIQRV